jgi:hypothetical protein
VLTLLLSAKAIAKAIAWVAAGIYAAFVVVARIANPSAIHTLSVLEFVLTNYSGWWVISMISDDITTSSLAH